MELPELKGSPKQTAWASRIRKDRLKVWGVSSSEMFKDIENKLVTMTDAGWWISYKDKAIDTVFNHFVDGIDLNKIQRDEWEKKQKKHDQKDSAGVRAYLKKELEKESQGKKITIKSDFEVALCGSNGDGLMRWESQAIDTRTGQVCSDSNCPF